MEQLVITQTQVNAKRWEQMPALLEAHSTNPPMAPGLATNPAGCLIQPMVVVQKMTPAEDPEAFLNTFERTEAEAGWPEGQ